MTEPEAVREALARLARDARRPRRARGEPGIPPQRHTDEAVEPPGDPEPVVQRAVAATDDVERAAAFLLEQDLAALEAAVRALDEAGEDAGADRGRRALRSFRRFREACGVDP